MASEKDLQGKVFVVTGANSGIGYESSLDFAKRGATVVLVCRNEGRGKQALNAIKQESGNDDVHLYIADFSRRSGQTFAADLSRPATGLDTA